MVHRLGGRLLMFLSWFGQRIIKRCSFLLLVTIIKVIYFLKLGWKIRMIGQMDGIENYQP
jgi:hypothetical protein